MCVDKVLLAIVLVLQCGMLVLFGLHFADDDGFEGTETALVSELLGFVNSAHYPLPYEELSRPDLGNCCGGLCSGSTCYVGTQYALDSASCNLCCFHLVAPASCVGSECTCYANSQE